MAISVRLEPEMERALAKAAARMGISKSEIIRSCLREYIEFGTQSGDSRLAWELGKDVFGKSGSGRTDLSVNHEDILRKKLHAKQRDRRLRSPDRSVRRRRSAS